MRVFAGLCRSRILKSLRGLALRPTSERLLKAILNAIEETALLDLLVFRQCLVNAL
jgi:16S rRNA G966 N2-methylase RsmD